MGLLRPDKAHTVVVPTVEKSERGDRMNHKPGHFRAGLRRRVRAGAPRRSTRRCVYSASGIMDIYVFVCPGGTCHAKLGALVAEGIAGDGRSVTCLPRPDGGRKGDLSRFVQEAVEARLKEAVHVRGKQGQTPRSRASLAEALGNSGRGPGRCPRPGSRSWWPKRWHTRASGANSCSRSSTPTFCRARYAANGVPQRRCWMPGGRAASP